MLINKFDVDGEIMKKKLISAENITDYFDIKTNVMHVDGSMILTSGAKDYLREKKVELVYTGQTATTATPARNACNSQPRDLKTVVARIVSILRKDLQVADAGLIERVTQKVLCGLKRS